MTFEEFLATSQATPEIIQQALRLYISEAHDDQTIDQMKEQLVDAANEPAKLDTELASLANDPQLLELAATSYLRDAWEDPSTRASIEAAFRHAKTKLPVIELSIVAVVAMYGMYLMATGGITTETNETRKGKIVRKRTVKREPFAPIAALILRLFRRSK